MPQFKSWRDFWQFERMTINQNRYIRTAETEEFLSTVLQTARKRIKTLREGQILWRAQLGNDWQPICDKGERVDEIPAPHPPERMKPLHGRANEGRANPKGIPYLYLATKRDTALAEVRPWMGSYITVGQFKTLRKLHLIDCVSDHHSFIFYSKEPSSEKRAESVWAHIDQAFSRPVSRGDNTSNYVPTQVIAELFKANGFDGVSYRSSLGDGENIVLFDLGIADLVSCFVFQVKSIEFEFQESGNPYVIRKDCNASNP